MSKYTVLGGTGFIGSEFVKELKSQGHEVLIPKEVIKKYMMLT